MSRAEAQHKPQDGLLAIQRSTTRVGPAAHNERGDGWCGGVHFLIYPIHLNFKLPRGFTSASRLNYWF